MNTRENGTQSPSAEVETAATDTAQSAQQTPEALTGQAESKPAGRAAELREMIRRNAGKAEAKGRLSAGKEAGTEIPAGVNPTEPETHTKAAYEPLENWTAEEKAEFTALPSDEARRLWLERYKGWQRGFDARFEELADERKRYARLNKAVEPLNDYFKLKGIDPTAYFERLVELDRLAAEKPAEYLRFFLESRGLNPKELFQNEQKPNPLTELIDPIRQEVGQLKTLLAQKNQAELQAEVEAFMTAANEDGTPKYPHFEKLRKTMGTLLKTGQAQDLDDAYQSAQWLDPELRAQALQAARAQAQEDKRRLEAVQKAKAARVTVPETRHASEAPQGPLTPRDYIARAKKKFGLD